ncbi:hypothetical protein HDU98_003004 [Podochytrium sp. JEL0797]|nr:hypothetical protein HDU98_003004 [Podochytrium sp. JEL0797]
MAFAFLQSDKLTEKWHRKLHKSLKEAEVINEAEDDKMDRNEDEIEMVDTLGASNPATLSARDTSIDGCELVRESDLLVAEVSGKEKKRVMMAQDAGDMASIRKQRNKGVQAFFWIPFITVIREGLEGMVFLGGTAISEDPAHIPLAVLGGLLAGCAIGYAIYKAGNTMKLQTFFISATIFILYLSSGLMSKALWSFQRNTWNIHIGVADSDTSQFYDTTQSVWYVSCCNPGLATNGGWQLFNAIFGWTNSATFGSVGSYILYWLVVSLILVTMKLMERRRVKMGMEKVGFKRTVKKWLFGK